MKNIRSLKLKNSLPPKNKKERSKNERSLFSITKILITKIFVSY